MAGHFCPAMSHKKQQVHPSNTCIARNYGPDATPKNNLLKAQHADHVNAVACCAPELNRLPVHRMRLCYTFMTRAVVSPRDKCTRGLITNQCLES